MINTISSSVLPAILFLVALITLRSDKSAFDAFLDGASDGIRTAAGLLPSLCALIVATSMLFASGLADAVAYALSDVLAVLGLPSGITPLLITRPISGSASTAAYTELMEKYGADSYTATLASVIMGSSDTVIYVISVYFASAGVRKTRHAMPAAFAAMIFCILLSSFVCRTMLKV